MELHWHWLIVIYLFLGGIGAGAYLTSFAAEQGWLGKNPSLGRTGYYLSAPIVIIGTLLLVFDLGQGLHKPWLLIRLLANLQSVMTWGVYILSGFILIGLVKGYTIFKRIKIPAALTWAGAILALATGTYTGLLLAVVQAIPFWNSWIMPLLFVVSALSTGLSATCLLAPLVEKEGLSQGREGQAHLALIGLEILIAGVFFSLMLSGTNGSVGAQSAQMVVSGKFAIVFWGYFVVLGLIFPFIVYLIQFLKNRKAAKTRMMTTEPLHGEQAAILQKGHHSYVNIITDFAVLIGGLALRALIVFAALPLWDGFTI